MQTLTYIQLLVQPIITAMECKVIHKIPYKGNKIAQQYSNI